MWSKIYKMTFRTVFNGRCMVRRQILKKKGIKEQPAPAIKEGAESTQAGSGVKQSPETEASKQALREKLRAELFRGI